MNAQTLQTEIEQCVPSLLSMAKEATWNKISGNCLFILNEIKNSTDNFFEQYKQIKKENDKKIPTQLSAVISFLKDNFKDLYDINLEIYSSHKKHTVIDIRYYLKSSLEKEYQKKVSDISPMLHSKVQLPPWVSDKGEKFDINWRHKPLAFKREMFWLGIKIRRMTKARLSK